MTWRIVSAREDLLGPPGDRRREAAVLFPFHEGFKGLKSQFEVGFVPG